MSTLLIVKDFGRAKELTEYFASNRFLAQTTQRSLGMSDDTSVILFAAYTLKIASPGDTQATVAMILKTHVESEVENSLEYSFRLTRDLMVLNDTAEEEIFFEIPDRKLVEADAKERLLKSWKDREIELLREAAESI